MQPANEAIKRLFQHEYAKMVAVISSLFGLEHIEIAEDIVSETFLLALQDWGEKGLPVNPEGWLYIAAKRKTLYHFRRNKILQGKIIPALAREQSVADPHEPDFSEQNIKDSQLQMLFAVCNPAIVAEAQIGL